MSGQPPNSVMQGPSSSSFAQFVARVKVDLPRLQGMKGLNLVGSVAKIGLSR